MSKGVHRLFQVAKELNVATTVIVEHLHAKGYEVENTLHTKIPDEWYELLLKEFDSDKKLRQRADQILEKRNEERHQQTVVKEKPKKLLDDDFFDMDELLTPNKLKESALGVNKPVAKTESPQPPPPPEPPKVDNVMESKIPEYKPLGKIDLSGIGRKPVAPAPPPKEEKPVVAEPEPVHAPEPVQEAAPASVPLAAETAPQVTPEQVAPDPVAKEKPAEIPPPVVEQSAVPEAPAAEAPAAELPAPEAPAGEAPVKSAIITAGDNAPQLKGLKVVRTIDLEDPRKKKKEKEQREREQERERRAQNAGPATPPATTTPASSTDEESEDKKRKRKRKRKKTVDSGPTLSAAKNTADKKGPVKPTTKEKERPSDQQVGDSIRNTLAQLNRGASRDRQRHRRAKRDAAADVRRQREIMEEEESRVLEVTEFITANEFANRINIPVNEIIKSCFQLGMMVTINQRLEADVLAILAEEYGYTVRFMDVKEEDFDDSEEEEQEEELKPRSPVVTVMGHVDHGKTSLLDKIRNANVTKGEAGGITQHIGAYSVTLKEGRRMTFLDTPGHEAFTAMRARGAQITDIVIIVIAADDEVMPQTREAINHAQAASVPMVFALNKMDRPEANPERIKTQLAELNILVEDWGGSYQCQEISAKQGDGVEELLEKVLFQADLLELKANPDRNAKGTVIEARLDKGRGNVATVLVQNGTLHKGDVLVAGIHYGKVRALINQNGVQVDSAGPAEPVQVVGLMGLPGAGDRFQAFGDEAKAKSIATRRQELYREQQFRHRNRITLDEIGRRRAIGNFSELNIIIKGDVDGSVEALAGAFMNLSTPEVQVNILLKGVGAITENDVNLASASDAIIIAFNTRPVAQARTLAEREEIDIRTYSVIYDAINDVRDALEGMLSPDFKEEVTATVEVREVFKVTKVGNVAGCMVTSGKVHRNDEVRIVRDGVVIYTSKLASLKRFKDDAKEVASGFECGLMVENYNDVQVGDIIECFKKTEIKRKLS